MREVHAIEYEPKHQHYVNEINHIHEGVVELCRSERIIVNATKETEK